MFHASGLSLFSNCGKSFHQNNLKFSNKIIGGSDAVAHSWPSLVGLFGKLPHDNGINFMWSQFCGGTLIDKQTVLTAAQ